MRPAPTAGATPAAAGSTAGPVGLRVLFVSLTLTLTACVPLSAAAVVSVSALLLSVPAGAGGTPFPLWAPSRTLPKAVAQESVFGQTLPLLALPPLPLLLLPVQLLLVAGPVASEHLPLGAGEIVVARPEAGFSVGGSGQPVAHLVDLRQLLLRLLGGVLLGGADLLR